MIPFLIAGAVIGLGAHACASVDNDEAREKNRRANEIIDESNRVAQEAKTLCQGSIDELAKEKTRVLQGNMKRFVRSFSQIKPVNFKDSGDLFEIAKFNRNELTTMQSMVSSVQKVGINDVVGGVSGTALAIGAADILAGGTILSGAGISVGGLAGGAALGAVAAPIFAVTGIFSASEAAANLEKAKSNLSKAKAYRDECETYSFLAHAVSERCDLFYEALRKIDITWFTDAVNELEKLVNSKKSFGNFLRNISGKKIYTRQEMQMVASAASLAKMVKTIIDTNILDNNGHVTNESERVILEIQNRMDNEDLTVKMPEPEIKKQKTVTHAVQDSLQTNTKYNGNTVVQSGQSTYQAKSEQNICNPSSAKANNLKKTQSTTVTNNVKFDYVPNKFVKFIMWYLAINICLSGGICLVDSVIGGFIVIASGLMMCPKINKKMKFWPRFGLMILLIIIAGMFM